MRVEAVRRQSRTAPTRGAARPSAPRPSAFDGTRGGPPLAARQRAGGRRGDELLRRRRGRSRPVRIGPAGPRGRLVGPAAVMVSNTRRRRGAARRAPAPKASPGPSTDAGVGSASPKWNAPSDASTRRRPNSTRPANQPQDRAPRQISPVRTVMGEVGARFAVAARANLSEPAHITGSVRSPL